MKNVVPHNTANLEKERRSETRTDGARARARRAENLLKMYDRSTTTTLKIQNLAYPITCDPIWRAASRRLKIRFTVEINI